MPIVEPKPREAPPATPDTPPGTPQVDPSTLPTITPKVAPRLPDGNPEIYYTPRRLCPDQRRDAGDGARPR
jgi:hypothetical protein